MTNSSTLTGFLQQPGLTRELILDILQGRKRARRQSAIDRSIPAVRARCAASLYDFVQEAWHVLEPSTRFVPGWHVRAITDHLSAITEGEITRLLINVPPGSMKSLLVSVFWPSWEWGPCNLAGMRYLCTSFREDAVARDSRKMRMLVQSEWYQTHWPHVELTRMGELSFENSVTGMRDGISMASLTSKRADRLIVDDPHSVEKAESETDRRRTVARFREGAINRLNDQAKSAIIVVMQRLHQGDISGEIQDTGMGYTQLVLPMEFEESRRCETEIGFVDPRKKDGDLLCPARFPPAVVADLKRDMGPYGYAGQYQQRPAPRGGGILPYNGWEYWSKSEAARYGRNETQFPDFDVIIGSLDTAYTEKQENDLSALVVLGMWANLYGQPQVMLMHFWQGRLKFADLVEKVTTQCRKMRVQRLLIEGKGNGISIGQEIRRLTRDEEFAISEANPNVHGVRSDKMSRAESVAPLFGERTTEGVLVRKGLIWAPAIEQSNGDAWPRAWADELMNQAAQFPKARHDDGVDALVQGLRWLRDRGLIRKPRETEAEDLYKLMAPGVGPPALYPGTR